MKAVAGTFAVARSNLIERVSGRQAAPIARRKAGDEPLLALIGRLVDECPAYGYRRIAQLVKRQQKQRLKSQVVENHRGLV